MLRARHHIRVLALFSTGRGFPVDPATSDRLRGSRPTSTPLTRRHHRRTRRDLNCDPNSKCHAGETDLTASHHTSGPTASCLRLHESFGGLPQRGLLGAGGRDSHTAISPIWHHIRRLALFASWLTSTWMPSMRSARCADWIFPMTSRLLSSNGTVVLTTMSSGVRL